MERGWHGGASKGEINGEAPYRGLRRRGNGREGSYEAGGARFGSKEAPRHAVRGVQRWIFHASSGGLGQHQRRAVEGCLSAGIGREDPGDLRGNKIGSRRLYTCSRGRAVEARGFTYMLMSSWAEQHLPGSWYYRARHRGGRADSSGELGHE